MTDALARVFHGAARVLGFPVALLVATITRVLLPRRSVRIVVMDPRYFGHQCLEPEVFWNDWQSAKEQGSRDLWFCCLGKKSAAANSYLWEHTKQKFPTVPSWLVTRLAPWLQRLRFSNIVLISASIYRLNFLTERESTLPTASSFSERRSEILANLEDPERPYVVFTIRDLNVSYDPDDPRNRDINEFVPAMNALARRGFNVIRLTSKTGYRMTTKSQHVLDWQVLIDGREGDELVLLSGAAFVVSTTTGGDCLALAYRRPVLYVDSARLYLVFLATELATFYLPQLTDAASGQNLRLQEILAKDLGWVSDSRSFKKVGVAIRNSSPPEIERRVIEFADCRDQQREDADSDLQGRWRQPLLSRHAREVATRHGEIRAKMLPSSIADFT